ncbi:MAG: protein kinase, partial [Myxococcota bacterium]|nr:protein kinase [Myxococcota bacterium]
MEHYELEIPGLELGSLVGQGAHSVVFRARRGATQCAVKIPRNRGILRPEQRSAFLREAAIAARVSDSRLPKIYESGVVDDCPFIVMEFMEGTTLAMELGTMRLTSEQARQMGGDIAGALNTLHQKQILHRDVKPQNILVGSDGGARLVDYGISKKMTEDKVLVEQTSLTGTLQYAAPEQTGVVTRPVDYRADLYALGIVLYEALSGRLPFVAMDMAELLRQHAFQDPPSLRSLRSEISPAFACIIHKLLMKDPDDRYQSAAALAEDLKNLEKLDELEVGVLQDSLGSFDSRFRNFLPPTSRRVGILSEAMGFCREGLASQGRILFFLGERGSGRTYLANELCRKHLDDRWSVLSGEAGSNVEPPFSVLRRSIDQFIRCQAHGCDERSRHYQHSLTDALMDERSLTRFSSQLERFLPPHLREEDDRAEVGERQAALLRLFVAISEFSNGLVLFIDECQWCDEASLSTLYAMIPKILENKIFLVFTGEINPVIRAFYNHAEQRLGDGYVMKVPVLRFSVEELDEYLKLSLNADSIDPRLTREVHSRSNGRPSAVEECLLQMLSAGVLSPNWGSWKTDYSSLSDLTLSEDLVTIVVSKLHKISSRSRDLLCVSSLLGMTVDIRLLCALDGYGEAECYNILNQGVHLHILRADDFRDRFVFLHNEVREALLEEVSDSRSAVVHRNFALVMSARKGEFGCSDYDIANHFRGARSVLSQEEIPLAIESLKNAGFMAIREQAYGAAASYLDECLMLYGENPSLMPDDLGDIYRWQGESFAHLQKFEQADVALRNALKSTENSLTRARICANLSAVMASRYKFKESRQLLVDASKELGFQLPRSSVFTMLLNLFRWGFRELTTRLGILSREKPGPRTGRIRLWVEVLDRATTLNYYEFDLKGMVASVLEQLRVASRLEPCSESLKAYSAGATVAAAAGAGGLARGLLTVVRKMADVSKRPHLLARSDATEAMIEAFLGNHNQSQLALNRLRRAERGEDPWLLTATYIMRAFVASMQGDTKSLATIIEEGRWHLQLSGYGSGSPEFFYVMDLFDAQLQALKG